MGSGDRRKSLVLDSTAFYAGIPFTGIDVYHTTSKVIKEVSHGQLRNAAIQSLLDGGRLIELDPTENVARQVKETARRSGDLRRVSDTDLSVVALALQLKEVNDGVTIISDDYSVENLASLFKINHAAVMTRGISRTVHWLVYCSGCGKAFGDRRIDVCDVCGTRVKRKIRG